MTVGRSTSLREGELKLKKDDFPSKLDNVVERVVLVILVGVFLVVGFICVVASMFFFN